LATLSFFSVFELVSEIRGNLSELVSSGTATDAQDFIEVF